MAHRRHQCVQRGGRPRGVGWPAAVAATTSAADAAAEVSATGLNFAFSLMPVTWWHREQKFCTVSASCSGQVLQRIRGWKRGTPNAVKEQDGKGVGGDSKQAAALGRELGRQGASCRTPLHLCVHPAHASAPVAPQPPSQRTGCPAQAPPSAAGGTRRPCGATWQEGGAARGSTRRAAEGVGTRAACTGECSKPAAAAHAGCAPLHASPLYTTLCDTHTADPRALPPTHQWR